MDKKNLKIIKFALEEDVGKKDITSSLIPKDAWAKAQVISQKKTIVCGVKIFNEVFRQVDRKIKIKWLVKDGQLVSAKKVLCKLDRGL